MNTQSISLSGPGRTEFPHVDVLTSNKSRQEDKGVRAPSDRSLTRLQRGRLSTEEVSDPYFKGEKTLIGRTFRDLKGEKVIPWNKISDEKLVFVSQKALEIAFKKFLKNVEWERLYEYLQDCRRKLKDHFRELYSKILVEKEELKKAQIKNQVKSEKS